MLLDTATGVVGELEVAPAAGDFVDPLLTATTITTTAITATVATIEAIIVLRRRRASSIWRCCRVFSS